MFPWIEKILVEWDALHVIELDGIPYVEISALVEEFVGFCIMTVTHLVCSMFFVSIVCIVMFFTVYRFMVFFFDWYRERRDRKRQHDE